MMQYIPPAVWIILAIGVAWALVILAGKVPNRSCSCSADTTDEENDDARTIRP